LGKAATVAGIAPVDLGNPNRRDVAFVFSAEISTLKQVANCISHGSGTPSACATSRRRTT
jgi:hypothetical protein